tara:strand:+ start:157 stop:1284 length:1128 start_codon:yes stop_codon:yes gene_type:complete
MLINTPNQVLKLPDQKKALLERINYINPKIKSCRFVKDLIILQINEKLKNKEIELIKKDLRKISNRIATDKAFSEERVIFINYVKQSSNTIKTYDKLLKEKDLKQISPGLFTLKGKLLKEFNNLNQVLLNYSKKSNFQDMYVHSMLPTKSLIDNGYLSNFAHHVFFSSNIETKISSIDKISNLDHDDLDEIKKKLDLPKMVMSPAVCYHCFETLKKTRINKNIVYNSISSCNRFENQNYKSLERLQSFTMREYVAFGDEKFINSFLKKTLNYFKKYFIARKIYFRIVTASDAFFSQKGMSRMAYQKINELKYEIQFWLPDEKKWLAVGSFNNHLDVLSKKYEIINRTGKILNSACIAWGYERLVYALISQKKKIL